ncbi:MAG: pyridoxal phosphate-dependent aminotransferase [Bacteroidia bacterium]|nr:MAG: pyridoxal phosphate-dependent aminotransferase [Bacteroidia bacterium]
MRPRIYLSPPHMGNTEQAFVNDAFATNWIAPLGPNVDGFEADLAKQTGVKHVAALSSGTAAIHLALILLDVQPGDYVICQSLTFSASANPIRYLGATPVFVDSEPETWNMCPLSLEKAIAACTSGKITSISQLPVPSSQLPTPSSRLPKAILPVHLYGMPAKMDEILAVAAKYNIPVVEDAAEALGSHIKGKQCGSFGDFGILSFNGNKIITTSGGGALLSNNEAMIQKARFLATQARDPAPHYQHSEIGYNYRMSNVLAGIGRGQMQVLSQRIAQRRANYDFYMDLLKDVPGISFLPEPDGFFSNRWLSSILVDPAQTGGITREAIRLAMEKENIESRPIWKPMHQQPVFASFPFFSTGVSDKLFQQGLCLPSGSSLTPTDRERIAKVLRRVLET